ncbi:hypothetical protein WJX74_005187 [Apatococcus lobatus]|uniref:Golgin-84 n=1 Tax=Apatococcus lobatus TaxID=904363 RepID=A0AAW1RDX0_9CHLO
MGSWFKAAESFLESVDKTAKTVSHVRGRSGDSPEPSEGSDSSLTRSTSRTSSFVQEQKARTSPSPQGLVSTQAAHIPARKRSGQLEAEGSPKPTKQVLKTPPPAFKPVVKPVASRPAQTIAAAAPEAAKKEASRNDASEAKPRAASALPSNPSPAASHAQRISPDDAATPDALAAAPDVENAGTPSQPLASVFAPSPSATEPAASGTPSHGATAAASQAQPLSSSPAIQDGASISLVSPHANPSASTKPPWTARRAAGQSNAASPALMKSLREAEMALPSSQNSSGTEPSTAQAEGTAPILPSVNSSSAHAAQASSILDGTQRTSSADLPAASEMQPQLQQEQSEGQIALAAAASEDASKPDSPAGMKDDKTASVAAAVAAAIQHASAAAGPSSTGEDDAMASSTAPPASVSTREAKLAKLVDTLKGRLEALRGENKQLEELLLAADNRASGEAEDVQLLKSRLKQAEAARAAAEADTGQAAASWDAEAAGLRKAAAAAESQAREAEALLTEAEQRNEALLQDRLASEDQMLRALREQVSIIEQHLEAERSAHTSTRRAFQERERQLEASAAEAAGELTVLQRRLQAAEEASRKLEQQALQLQADKAALTASSPLHSPARPGQAGGASPAAVAKLEQEVQRQRSLARQASQQSSQHEAAALAAQQDAQYLQQEVLGLRQQLAQADDSSQLQNQVAEVTELLWMKQTQLEQLAGEKAALQLSLERALHSAREDAERIKRRSKSERSAPAYPAVDDVVVPMDALGDTYFRLANHDRVGRAVRVSAQWLDTFSASAMRFLRQYPLGRLLVFLYAIFVHLFIWLLIIRLQHRAFNVEELDHPRFPGKTIQS